jgi:dolichol-phosphate mannosyltransferase
MFLSIIVPLFNEEAVLPALVSRLNAVLDTLPCTAEVILVDDGSRDQTRALATDIAERDQRYRLLSLTRNFGHQVALTAGLDCAEGDAALIIDGDLQDPPELLGQMLTLYEQGFDVVSAQRSSREGDAFWKRASISAFYWVLRKAVDERISPEVGDFRLLSRSAILALRQFREQHRFMRGLIAWLGLKEAVVPYKRDARAAGTSKYPVLSLVAFAWTAVTSFSALPLRLTVLAGLGLSLLGGLYFCYAAYQTLIVKTTLRGWATLVFLQVLFSGATLLAIGLIGEYLARVYDESKGRPLYVVRETVNLRHDAVLARRTVFLEPRERETQPPDPR